MEDAEGDVLFVVLADGLRDGFHAVSVGFCCSWVLNHGRLSNTVQIVRRCS